MDATSALGWFCYYGLYGPVEIDACIDLICEDVRGKVDKVRAPVEMLPDAAWISVEYCPDWPPEAGLRPEALDIRPWIIPSGRGAAAGQCPGRSDALCGSKFGRWCWR